MRVPEFWLYDLVFNFHRKEQAGYPCLCFNVSLIFDKLALCAEGNFIAHHCSWSFWTDSEI
jgi:hypothetical protein